MNFNTDLIFLLPPSEQHNWIILCSLYNHSMNKKKKKWLSFFIWENWGWKKLNDLFEVIHVVG